MAKPNLPVYIVVFHMNGKWDFGEHPDDCFLSEEAARAYAKKELHEGDPDILDYHIQESVLHQR